ncbi:MAG: dephospho-CoA kinase [Prevotella sp.]|uniref:dephospho-CoA kinase n=1 Tax=Prevotella sp. TaxID=59823 RepID=UPI002A307704|nr:dephospho-CoA kinase [Prevotella sp.]MDD7317495.1 dephospho-CoA kinase [Prevotellaceae bacterium]MDY4019169.1 dephospho-CoA kinase [Prevotella sp.]
MKTAITGGIGSGKSYVCQILRQQGIDIYDCDSAAKRLMRTSDELKEQLKRLVGDSVYIDGQLNKPFLVQFLLAGEENKRAVNGIVHPAVARDFEASGKEWMECAILFESGFYHLVDRIICVSAPRELRISRIMERDGITRSKAEEWIGIQMSQEEVEKRSHIVINNDGSPLSPQLEKITVKAEG